MAATVVAIIAEIGCSEDLIVCFMPNTHRRRDETVELRCIGGVYWVLRCTEIETTGSGSGLAGS